jgi:hypothetical protein
MNVSNHFCTSVGTLCAATAGIAMVPLSLAAQTQTQTDADDEVEILYVGDQYSYDDNLFRLPEDRDIALVPGVQSREDYINRLTVGIGEDMELGRQVFTIKGRAQDVRYSENDHLDHVAGRGELSWDWLITSALSGTLDALYTRSLADFSNSRGTEKDLIETLGYEGSIRYRLGPRWSLLGGARTASTEHDLQIREIEDFESDSGRVGIQYTTPTQHTFGLEYRYLEAQFPNLPVNAAGQREADYEESSAVARLGYTLSVHTHLFASYGYVERTQANDEELFSGNVWRAEIGWQPRPKFSTKLAAWRELRAYVDAEADYFVADGFSITPKWTPIRQLSLSFALSWEDQEYIGLDVLDPTISGRVDDVFTGLATLAYSPRENWELELSYRAFDRESNRETRQYDAAIAGASIRWRIL